MVKGILTVMTIGAAVFLSFQAYVYSEKPEVGRDRHEVWGEEERSVVAANNRFSLDLYNKLYQINPQQNAFFSPLSISTALAMTVLGARGSTEQQMLKTLSLDSEMTHDTLHGAFKFILRELTSGGHEASYVFRLANRVYLQKDYHIVETFKTSTSHFYSAQSENMDFKQDTENSRTNINKWVSDATESKIEELLKPGVLDTATRLVLINAIYFKGNWQKKFSKDSTQQQQFHVSDDVKVNVNMMHQKDYFRNGHSLDLDADIIELPYFGSDLIMTILLPSDKNGLPNLEGRLTYEVMSTLSAPLKNSSIDVYIPKFSVRGDYNLVDVLTGLGMRDLFVPGMADLSGITGTRELHVSHVIHQAFIDVDEDGSEAAAATAVIAMERSMITRSFRADHPFVYYITDKKTQSIIFMGRVVNPPTNSTNEPRADL